MQIQFGGPKKIRAVSHRSSIGYRVDLQEKCVNASISGSNKMCESHNPNLVPFQDGTGGKVRVDPGFIANKVISPFSNGMLSFCCRVIPREKCVHG